MATVTILPESDNKTLCVRLTGTVTAQEFDQFLHQEIKSRAEKNGFFNMLVEYDAGFEGWTAEAADLNLKSIIELAKTPNRIAYVNPDRNKIMLMKLTQPLIVGEIKYFDAGDFQSALKWVKG